VHALVSAESASSRPMPTFEKGESVKIIDGPFAGFTGIVDEIHTDLKTLKVLVTLFGRSTPIQLDFWQVEKG
jgi:transcriptional antiterminator NusG